MKRAWCADLPVVTVPVGTASKSVTLIVPYYCNGQFLAQQIAGWRAYPKDLLPYLSVIIVDDGSPDLGPRPLFEGWDGLFGVRIFAIGVDVRWNWLAARNIGAHHASDGWLLLTDMDHVVPPETLRSLIEGQHDPSVIYGFSRREHTGERIGPHPNSWLMTRGMFWTVGGYDERLSGHYGTDGDWRRRCAATAMMQILSDQLVRHEFVADSSTVRYLRKQPQDAAVKRLVSKRTIGWRPKVLSFPYQEVAL